MISLFRKKDIKEINLINQFPWIKNLDSQKIHLAEESIEVRLNEVKSIHKFLKSENGKILLGSVYDQMIDFGFPRIVALYKNKNFNKD